VKPEAWIDAATGAAFALEGLSRSPVAAFCGLANPASFWESLDQIGCRVVYRREFGDHHRYPPSEIGELERAARKAGADTLVTTEKDLANLAHRPALGLFWLRIGLEVENAGDLLGMLPR
jgi:tetraacyldisaccharide 4'-kinase